MCLAPGRMLKTCGVRIWDHEGPERTESDHAQWMELAQKRNDRGSSITIFGVRRQSVILENVGVKSVAFEVHKLRIVMVMKLNSLNIIAPAYAEWRDREKYYDVRYCKQGKGGRTERVVMGQSWQTSTYVKLNYIHFVFNS